ncbi:MAG TPA: hypothetical protein VNM67_16160 [Thermoanaerobaculia bacterium]|nr:hypothetical protein [Thermoanaerobaculia bacterium]
MSDELRSILSKGDPAAGDPGLTPDEVQGMRRTVLSAVPEPRRRGWLVPAMVTAAALILAAVIALSLWQPEPVQEAVRPPLPLAGEGRGEGPVMEAEKPPPQPSPAARERGPEPVPRKKKVVHPEPEPVVLAQAEIPPADHGPTQIQFSTPGGTRIIWVLQPATE